MGRICRLARGRLKALGAFATVVLVVGMSGWSALALWFALPAAAEVRAVLSLGCVTLSIGGLVAGSRPDHQKRIAPTAVMASESKSKGWRRRERGAAIR